MEGEQGQSLMHLLQETKAHKKEVLEAEWGNRGGQQRPQAHMAEQPKTEENSATGGFNSEEMEKLRSLLGSLDKRTGTHSLALSDTPSHSLFA